jgi:hypothetical protein
MREQSRANHCAGCRGGLKSAPLTVEHAIAERIGAGASGARVRVDDRGGEEADWY